MKENSQSIRRANGGMHYADAVYRKHAPTVNYVRYLLKLMNHNLFDGEPCLICFSDETKLRINFRGSYFMMFSTGWVESFRQISPTSFENFLLKEFAARNITYDQSSYYYRNWLTQTHYPDSYFGCLD